MNKYEEQANKFLKDTQTEFKAEFLKHGKHFDDDDSERDIYLITLERKRREFKFNFGQSLANSGLRLFHDKERTDRTRHKNFDVPSEVRLKYMAWKGEVKKKYFSNPLKIWFEKNHFNLAGLTFDLGEDPTAYDVLSCLTKYEVGTFEDFCGEYGYDTDSRKAEKTYNAVLNEWNNIKMLYTDDEIRQLAEIQ